MRLTRCGRLTHYASISPGARPASPTRAAKPHPRRRSVGPRKRPQRTSVVRQSKEALAGGGRHGYRTSGARDGALMFGAIAAGCVVFAAVTSHEGARVFGWVTAVVCLGIARRMWRVGIYVEPTGVMVVNYFWTSRVPWGDIDRFALRPAGQYPYVGHILRSNGGRRVVIAGIETPPGESEEHRLAAEAAIYPLNQALEAWRRATRLGETPPTAIALDEM